MSRLIRSLMLVSLAVIIAVPAVALATPRAAWRAAPEGTVKLSRFTFARAVKQRKPHAETSAVAADGKRLYAFIQVFNKSTPQVVTMIWQKGDRTLRYSLKVGRSPAWHTWSYMTASRHTAGTWTVSVEDQQGSPLGQQSVTIGAGKGKVTVARAVPRTK